MWLTVPVTHKLGISIMEIRINPTVQWAKKHLHALVTNYSKAPFFNMHEEYFREIYSRNWEYLSELNEEMLGYFIQQTGIATEITRASSLGKLPEDPNERLAAIVKKTGGDVYLAGHGSKDYLSEGPFREIGIQVVFQDYEPARYSQLYDGFIPRLAVVDALFNVGGDTLRVIREGRRTVL